MERRNLIRCRVMVRDAHPTSLLLLENIAYKSYDFISFPRRKVSNRLLELIGIFEIKKVNCGGALGLININRIYASVMSFFFSTGVKK